MKHLHLNKNSSSMAAEILTLADPKSSTEKNLQFEL